MRIEDVIRDQIKWILENPRTEEEIKAEYDIYSTSYGDLLIKKKHPLQVEPLSSLDQYLYNKMPPLSLVAKDGEIV